MFVRQGDLWNQSITLNSPTAKEQELLRNTFALFKDDSIQCLLDHLRGSEPIVSDENVGWFEDGFSEPFRPYFIPNRAHLQKCVMDSLLIIDLTDILDEDSSARTDLAFDVLFLSLLSIVSDEAFHKPARHLLARMFEMSEGELERLLLEREVRRGDLEMEWLGSGSTKEDTLSFAEGVWMLLGGGETEEEQDEDTSEADTDEVSDVDSEQATDGVEYPRTVKNKPFDKPISIPTVFLSRVACLLISALFSASSDRLPSKNKPTASTDTTHLDCDPTDNSASEPKYNPMSESHLFRISLKLTWWFQATFKKGMIGHVSTTSLRMNVESAVSLVFLLLPHADLDSQCFLVSLLRHFSQFILLEPPVITPNLVRKVALFFARLGPSLPTKLVRSVEYSLWQMMAGTQHSQWGPEGEEAAELSRPILEDLVSRLESDVEGRREIAAQIWVIVASNDHNLRRLSSPLVPLLSVLSDATDDEAFFILRASTRTITQTAPGSGVLFSMLLQHSSTILRFGKRMDRPQVVTEAWRLLLLLLVKSKEWFEYPKEGKTTFVEMSEQIVMEFVETVEKALQMRGQPHQTVGRDDNFINMLHVLGSFFVHFQRLFDIDFSPLILSLIPIVTQSQQFFIIQEDSIWIRIYNRNRTIISSFQPPTPFRFIATSSSFPTEQSVFDDILNRKLARVASILRFGRYHTNHHQQGLKCVKRRLFKSVNHTLQVKMALECAIRLPRLLHNAIPFREIRPVSYHDTRLIVWAPTDGNRRDALPPTNEEDSSPSETGLSFSENLQFAAMWMLNGMVEFPFSSRVKRGDKDIPLLWKLMLHSILFHPPFHHSIAQTAVQLRVCLFEEGVEDAVDAVGGLLDRSFGNQFGWNTLLPAVEEDEDSLDEIFEPISLFD
ncbi:hypothetical protein BLNAU_9085 [Blattamonas nauphoetae]|uniref:Uncharacterized protein n=1 Tax=Blattamonas nauphoetae TaxID=2049346 RepID=A0ABQ9XWT9_9EUKA|nr:hypothetical protein BLNAU_9085 [Blattamonas nauphoetae]